MKITGKEAAAYKRATPFNLGNHMPVLAFVGSLFGPAYFGYHHDGLVVAFLWAIACAAIFFWFSRASLQFAIGQANEYSRVPFVFSIFVTLLIFVSIAVLFVGVHSAIYFFVSWVTSGGAA